MLAEWYRAHGYEISANYAQSIIDKAEDDVWDAYIQPVIQNASREDETLFEYLGAMSYLYLCMENAKVTRKGTKEKQDANSTTIKEYDLTLQRSVANKAFYKMASREDAREGFEVHDILSIWAVSPIIGI